MKWIRGCLGALIIGIIGVVIIGVLTSSPDAPSSSEDRLPVSTSPVKKAPGAKHTEQTYGDGDYAIGRDIPSGTYESAGAKKDLFDFCTIMTEPDNSNVLPQIKSAEVGQRIIITLSSTDGVVSIDGCEPLKRRAD